jgi:hypothetical protein
MVSFSFWHLAENFRFTFFFGSLLWPLVSIAFQTPASFILLPSNVEVLDVCTTLFSKGFKLSFLLILLLSLGQFDRLNILCKAQSSWVAISISQP